MPVMDGIELCEILRVLDPSCRAQIVMVASLSERCLLDRAFKAGANDFLTKPLDDLELKVRLGSIRRIHSERRRNEAMHKEIEAISSLRHLVDFDTALPPDPSIGTVTPSSLEKYVRSLGRLRKLKALSIGFHVENAESLYKLTGDEEFARIMNVVAVAISNAAGPSEIILASVGQGDFVGIAPMARSVPERGVLEARINAELNRRFVRGPDGICASVGVGEPIGLPMLSKFRMSKVLASARTRLQTSVTSPSQSRHFSQKD